MYVTITKNFYCLQSVFLIFFCFLHFYNFCAFRLWFFKAVTTHKIDMGMNDIMVNDHYGVTLDGEQFHSKINSISNIEDMIKTSLLLTRDEAKSGDRNTITASGHVDCIFIVRDMQGSPRITRGNDTIKAIKFDYKWVANTSGMKLFVIKDENDLQNMSHLVETKEELQFLIKDHSQRDSSKAMYFMVLPQVNLIKIYPLCFPFFWLLFFFYVCCFLVL